MNYVDRATRYARGVVNGDIVAGKLVINACQRFLDDLSTDTRWVLSEKHANHVCAFMENGINHVKGELAGTLLELQPWQIFILVNMYGWRDANETRRFQYVVLEIARKSGKSLFASGCAIYELLFGGEGCEVYSVATKMDQAKLCWDGAVQMINKSEPDVKSMFKVVTNQVTNSDTWSFYKPLGRDSKSLDGLNPSLCIFDEAAAYSDRNLVEVMTSATGARKNFMHLFITTAQFSKTTIYYENRSYLEAILTGKIEDDRWFGMIFSLDNDEEWLDEDCWIKANPGLDVSISKEFLRNEVKQAKEMNSKRNNVLVKHFNRWVSSSEAWIDPMFWNREVNIIDKIDTSGELYVGMDLAMTSDLCAVALLYVNGNEFHADFKCFLPEEALHKASVAVEPIYREAHRRGSLILTDGPITDYNQIQSYIQQLAKGSNFKVVAYDPYNAPQLVTNLEDLGINMLEVKQSISHLSPAAKETESLICSDKIKHLDDPFITWQLENCVRYVDINENVKVRKGDDNTQKIDAIIALIMAVSLAAGKLEEPKTFNLSFVQF